MQEKVQMLQENSTYPLDIESNLDIARAWESFTDCGDVHASKAVRQVIRQGWLKSRDSGIRPDIERARTVISELEIEEKIRTEDLGRAGVPVLEELSDCLKDTQHVIVLADPAGRIFYSVGHRQVQDKLEHINFRPGGAWSEQDVGPNGVGTPLSIGRPEVVMGHEHYCQGWHPWVCYGAPILDPATQKILGVVDITGPVKNVNWEAMALAISVAHSVQSGVSVLQFQRREALREIGKEKIKHWSSDGVMVLDESGFIVEYNTKSIKQLNLDPSAFLNKTISQLIPRMSESVQKSFNYKRQVELNIQMEGKVGSLRQSVKVHIKPVMNGHQCIGTALIMTDPNQYSTSKKYTAPCSIRPQSKYTFENISGSSEKIKKTIRLAKKAATDPAESNVLLYGETGTGKELLAHSIHFESARKNGPFIAVNCAAIPHDLIESELFGYVAGAFTGANRHGLKGKFELAHNGTLFLDEINSMSMGLQAKFLRVLDSMEINRVGSTQPVLVNVRIIAAANGVIYTAVEEGTFRLDLFHRINVLEIPIPRLSERGNDIIQLADEFLEKECMTAGRQKISLSPEVIDMMKKYHWPGNIRELNNICTRWVLTVSGNTVTYDDVPERMSKPEVIFCPMVADDIRSINDELIKQTLVKTGNNISKAARILGIDRTTIYRRRRSW